MKLAEKVIALYEGLNKGTLKAIVTEVTSSYSKKEMSEFAAFKDFFAAVDVQNGYEEEWDAKKYKPYYEEVWKQYKQGVITDFEESKISEYVGDGKFEFITEDNFSHLEIGTHILKHRAMTYKAEFKGWVSEDGKPTEEEDPEKVFLQFEDEDGEFTLYFSDGFYCIGSSADKVKVKQA